jgi:hypothetical protein
MTLKKSTFGVGENIQAGFSTSPFHSIYDWIGLFLQGAPDSDYISFVYVPSGSTGSILLNNGIQTAENVEIRYFLENNKFISATQASIVLLIGNCSVDCANPGAPCTTADIDTTCGACNFGGCNLPQRPEFLDPLPTDSTISTGFTGVFVIRMNEPGDILITGAPIEASFVVVLP